MTAPDPETTKYIRRIQKMRKRVIGPIVFSLTSRAPVNRFATVRELKKNGIIFAGSDLDHKIFPSGFFKSCDPGTVRKEYIFSPSEVKKFKLNRLSRDVIFKDGIFFTSGMHKGAMLRIILKKLSLKPSAIIFVDDKKKHTDGIQDAFVNTKIEVVTFRYSKEDRRVDAFNKSDKKKVVNDWNVLNHAFSFSSTNEIKKLTKKILVDTGL